MTNTNTTAKRVYNFSAGPAVMPEPVLRQAQEDLWSIAGTGIGILEHSHRGALFDRVIAEAEVACRQVGNISDDYEVLFLPGGATLQFGMVPMSFLPADRTADYLDTGSWTQKAIKDARVIGKVHLAFDGAACGYDHVPTNEEIKPSDDPVYTWYCSNNTIFGTQFRDVPAVSSPLVCDASSDIFSRPFPLERHAMVLAGAQKNLGPSGCSLVILRKDFMATARDGLASMLDYRQHAAKGSRLNTPPTFGIYVMGQTFKWILEQGGIAALGARNEAKAKIVYDAIDAGGGFYRPVAQSSSRSRTNITFRTPSAELDARFVKEALANDMSGLKGYRAVDGLRASMYNAFPQAGCEALASFMGDFAARWG